MFESNTNESLKNKVNLNTQSPIQRLTAFWAFSEAGLGGVLHITRLPFKGIFIAGAATLFIALIGQYSKHKGSILKSTILVIVVKYLVSPHTPITAAIAVFTQGLLGELFFLSQKLKKILIPIFSMLIQFLTAVQKILIVTILFGQNIWITVDNFANSVLNEIISAVKFEFSFLIIATYVVIHTLSGLYVGLFILQLLKYIEVGDANKLPKIFKIENIDLSIKRSVSKKLWFQKPSGIIILIFFLVVLGFSFLLPEWEKSKITNIVLMIVRALIIVTLWYFLVSPLIRKYLSKVITKQKIKHLEQIENILQFFPILKQVSILSWNESKGYKGIKRIKIFIFIIIHYILS